MSEKGNAFWTTLPGILTGIAALIGALTPVYLHFQKDRETSQPENTVEKKILPHSSVSVFDGVAQQKRSGFNFATETLVAWHSGEADILVNRTTDDEASNFGMSFFLQYEEGLSGNYSEAGADRNAKSGIAEVSAESLDQVSTCPDTSESYSYHWFAPKEKGIYCIRTRDAKHYAKIRVSKITRDGITFDWVYQPERISDF